jgi:hypothetical protein
LDAAVADAGHAPRSLEGAPGSARRDQGADEQAVWLAVIRQVGFHRGSRPNPRLYESWLADYRNKFPAASLAEWQAAERVIARAAGIDSLGDVRDR